MRTLIMLALVQSLSLTTIAVARQAEGEALRTCLAATTRLDDATIRMIIAQGLPGKTIEFCAKWEGFYRRGNANSDIDEQLKAAVERHIQRPNKGCIFSALAMLKTWEKQQILESAPGDFDGTVSSILDRERINFKNDKPAAAYSNCLRFSFQ